MSKWLHKTAVKMFVVILNNIIKLY